MTDGEENQLRAALVAASAALGMMVATINANASLRSPSGAERVTLAAAERALKMLEGALN